MREEVQGTGKRFIQLVASVVRSDDEVSARISLSNMTRQHPICMKLSSRYICRRTSLLLLLLLLLLFSAFASLTYAYRKLEHIINVI